MIAPLRDRPIRQKLLWTSGLASGFALVFACLAFVANERLTFASSFGRQLGIDAEIIGRNSAAALLFKDPTSAAATLEALRARPSILAAAIYTPDDRRFASYTALPSEGALPEAWSDSASVVGLGTNDLTVYEPIVFQGESIGAVAIRADLREMNERMRSYALIAALVLVISIATAFAISARLQRAISRPILSLTETAKAVAERKEYSVRACADGDDEIGFLVRTFNQMLGHIQGRERDLETALSAALESARLKSAFLANMSHEIRTPLNIILGYTEVLESTSDTADDEETEAFTCIRRAGKRLMETIDGILDISRIETGAFEVNRVPISLAEAVERCVQEARVLANQKGIVLGCENREPDAVVLFDAHCLSGALMNLLSNAIKFTERGTVTVRVARGTEGALELAVVDTGVGIAEDYLPRLFESFSQEDQSTTRRFEGSGLGLALVKRYAELNEARVSVTSTKGVGSTFVIHFARESEIATPKPARPTPADATGRRSSSGKPVALVVEDDLDSQAYMRVALRESYDVLFAKSVDEARQVLATHGANVRIVLLDIALNGGEDGLTLVRSLRRERAWSKTPIIATTALALPTDERNAYDAGCTAYLSKPLKRDVLLRSMRDALAGEALRTAS